MRKAMPDSIYRVPAIQSWLEDMARQGWRCTDISKERLARFEEAPPEECRYRLEPQLQSREEYLDAETLELYEQAGWAYVGASYQNEFYLWRSTRPDARELHTDPVAENEAYAWVSRIMRRRLTLFAVLDLVFIAMFAVLFWGRGFVLPFASRGVQPFPMNILVIAWTSGQMIVDWRALRELRRSLAAGIPKEHGAPYGARRRAMRVYWALAVAMVVLAFSELAMMQQYHTIRNVEDVFPCVTVQELGVESVSTSSAQWNQNLYGEKLDIWQWQGEYRCDTEIYDLRLGALAGQLLRDIARCEVKEESGWNMEPLEDGRFDEARYLRTEEAQYLVARRGNRVLYARMEVPEDLRDHLQAFDEALDREFP